MYSDNFNYYATEQQKRIFLRQLKEILGIESELYLTFFGKKEIIIWG